VEVVVSVCIRAGAAAANNEGVSMAYTLCCATQGVNAACAGQTCPHVNNSPKPSSAMLTTHGACLRTRGTGGCWCLGTSIWRQPRATIAAKDCATSTERGRCPSHAPPLLQRTVPRRLSVANAPATCHHCCKGLCHVNCAWQTTRPREVSVANAPATCHHCCKGLCHVDSTRSPWSFLISGAVNGATVSTCGTADLRLDFSTRIFWAGLALEAVRAWAAALSCSRVAFSCGL